MCSRTMAGALFALAGVMFHAQAQGIGDTPSALAKFEPYRFEAADGSVVDAERGEFRVPENRSDPQSRTIKLGFVRFASTSSKPGAPIVYLAGGPGAPGVGTAQRERFPLFMAMREVADVIAFDQRGTGWSNSIPRCDAGRAFPLDQALTRDRAISFMREQANICTRFWKKAGVDLTGYNTWESAADLDDLRQALGADKITLWGISYGTHLALATLKRYPERIDRAMLASIEDLDETVKLPALTDAFFARVQAVIDADERAKNFPELAGLMRAVFDKLEQAPLTVLVKGQGGEQVELVIGKFDLQLLVSGMIADPTTQAYLPVMFAGMAGGRFDEVAQEIHDRVRKDFGRFANGMPEAMDTASGVTARRLAQVEAQARTSLLGDALNYPMPHLAGAYGMQDLGDDFRAPVRSAVPTLFLSGTLDGRTYPESATQTAAGFSNATHVMIENAGHNLFMLSPEITQVMLAFLEGRPVERKRIMLPAPRFEY